MVSLMKHPALILSCLVLVFCLSVACAGPPLEVQSSETGKTEWIGDWNAAVKRNTDGYSVEMRIPFSILKYSSQAPNISVAFIRHHAGRTQVLCMRPLEASRDQSCSFDG